MPPWLRRIAFLDPELPAWTKALGYGVLGTLALFGLFLAYCFIAIVVGGGI